MRTRRFWPLLAVLFWCLGCDRATPTPRPPVLPTQPAPRVVLDAPTEIPTATPIPPSAADRAAVADLLARWALGDPGPLPGVITAALSTAPDHTWIAARLDGAAATTPATGVQAVPGLVLDGPAGARQGIFALRQDTDALIPYEIAWAGDGAAGAVRFRWQHNANPIDLTPLLVLDRAGKQVGTVRFTLQSASAPLWAPGGVALAYLDGAADPPVLHVLDRQGRDRAQGPAARLECDRCWPDPQWAPAGNRLAYTTSAVVGVAPSDPDVRGHLTWRLLALDVGTGALLFDQTGASGETAQVLGWDSTGAQVVIRRPLIPATAIPGGAGKWQDTTYRLRFDPPPARLEPYAP